MRRLRGTSSAELVYGEPLVVPGEFSPKPNTTADPTNFLQQLKEKVKALVPTATSRHGTPVSRICPELTQCVYVFVRRDSYRTPLQRPYDGPFQVLEKGPKLPYVPYRTLWLNRALRSDIVITDNAKKKMKIVDVAVAFENRYEAFEKTKAVLATECGRPKIKRLQISTEPICFCPFSREKNIIQLMNHGLKRRHTCVQSATDQKRITYVPQILFSVLSC